MEINKNKNKNKNMIVWQKKTKIRFVLKNIGNMEV